MPALAPRLTAVPRPRVRAGVWTTVLLLCGLLACAESVSAASPVRGVWVVAGANKNTITWERGDGTNTDVRIYRSTSDGTLGALVATVPAKQTSFVDSGLTNGTSYYYSLHGWDGSSESDVPPATVVRTGARFAAGRWWGDCSTVMNGTLWTFGGYTGGIVIAFLGIDQTIKDPVIRSYSPVSNVASDSPFTVPNVRYWCGAGRSNGAAYLLGGANGVNGASTYDAIYRFTGASAPGLMNGKLPSGRYQVSSATLSDGQIATIGGQSGSNEYKSIATFDPVLDPAGAIPSDETTLDYNASYGVQIPQLNSLDGSLYLSGGSDTNGSNHPLDITKQVDATWSPLTYLRTNRATMSSPRIGAASATLNDRIYVLGGATACGAYCTTTNLIESFDPRANSWRTEGARLLARSYRPTGHRIKGFIYIAGGNSGRLLSPNGYYSDIYRYDPGGQARGTPSAPSFATAPSGLSTSSAANSVTVSWTGGTLVDTYRVFRSSTPGQLGSLIEENAGGIDAPATSVIDSDVDNCVSYYTVTGIGYDGRETAATAQVATVPTVPGPCDPTSLRQFRSNGTTTIPAGAATTDGVTSDIVLRFDVTHQSAGHTITPWVEVRTDPAQFAATCGQSIPGVTFGGMPVVATSANTPYTAQVNVTGLAVGSNYSWRACGIDELGHTSTFVAFGAHPDFRIKSPTSDRYYLRSTLDSLRLTNVVNEQASTAVGTTDYVPAMLAGSSSLATGWYPLVPSTATDASGRLTSQPADVPRSNPAGAGWVIDDTTGRTITAGPLTVHVRTMSDDSAGTANIQCRLWRVTTSAGSMTASTFLGKSATTGDMFDGAESTRTCTPYTFAAATSLAANESLYVELWLNVTGAGEKEIPFQLLTDGYDSFVEMPTLAPVPPNVPVLVSPADTTSTGLSPTLTASYSHPNGTGGRLEFEVATSAAFGGSTIRTGQALGLGSGSNGAVTVSPALAAGTVYWRVRAVDDEETASAWSAPWSLVAAGAPPPTLTLTLDTSSLNFGRLVPNWDAFASVTASVATDHPTGYRLLVHGTAPGTDASSCGIGCTPIADAPGTGADPQPWTANVGGFGGITVRDASSPGGRLGKWGTGTGTAQDSTTLNEYAGIPTSDIVLHTRATATVGDTILMTLRYTPSNATSVGVTHTEGLVFTVVPDP